MDNPFWQFSLKLYQNEAIKEHCLLLQNKGGFNINLLLFCCWLAYAVEPVTKLEFQKACLSIADWQLEVSQRLRTTRQYLKSLASTENFPELYQGILSCELLSEGVQQQRLYQDFADRLKARPQPDRELNRCYLNWLTSETVLVKDETIDSMLEAFLVLIMDKLTATYYTLCR